MTIITKQALRSHAIQGMALSSINYEITTAECPHYTWSVNTNNILKPVYAIGDPFKFCTKITKQPQLSGKQTCCVQYATWKKLPCCCIRLSAVTNESFQQWTFDRTWREVAETLLILINISPFKWHNFRFVGLKQNYCIIFYRCCTHSAICTAVKTHSATCEQNI